MEHLIKLVETLAWPAAAIWLSYIFRSEIRKLLGRVSALKYKDIEAKFEKELTAAEEEAKKAIPEKAKFISGDEESVYPAPYDSRYEQLLRIADESPRAALLEAWIEVESSLSEAAEKFNIYNSRRVPPRKVVIELINTGKYAKTILPLFEDLRGLRNEAAHAPQFVPSKRQTRRYLQMAIEMALTFQNPLNIN
ncbi:MAG: hypothetical protein H8D22_10505 [Candidatus Cloacimonetes bacterium]|nr:hypothetical protein [Candidatus Cloacimonadota bacterium]